MLFQSYIDYARIRLSKQREIIVKKLRQPKMYLQTDGYILQQRFRAYLTTLRSIIPLLQLLVIGT